MVVMTEGLRTLGGDTMRGALMRFTHSPLSGATTGAISTAVLQSSSATTVAAVGFVGAGLIGFPEALGVIFGANLGTTITGWLVAILGLKLQLGTVMLPLIFIGVVIRLFAKPKWAAGGYAIAGFGLIFVGIGQMQQGMSGAEGFISPDILPNDTWIGRLQLVGLGAVATVITQSSSAGVATALTLLYAGAIRFEQAAALVIGMDIGTTFTAAIATIGGSVEARRTGLSHVIYNLMTGIIAILLISPYILLWGLLAPGELLNNAEIALVAFHSAFNAFGVIAVLPFTYRFASLIERLVPALGPEKIDRLDRNLLQQPSLALTATQHSVQQAFTLLMVHLDELLGYRESETGMDLASVQRSLDEMHLFLDDIHLQTKDGADWERLIALMHALDHMQRMHERFEEDEDRALTAKTTHELADECLLLSSSINGALDSIGTRRWQVARKLAENASLVIEQEVERYRAEVMSEIAVGKLNVTEGTDCLEAIRWLKRVSRHIARVIFHLEQANLASARDGHY